MAAGLPIVAMITLNAGTNMAISAGTQLAFTGNVDMRKVQIAGISGGMLGGLVNNLNKAIFILLEILFAGGKTA